MSFLGEFLGGYLPLVLLSLNLILSLCEQRLLLSKLCLLLGQLGLLLRKPLCLSRLH